MNKSTIIIISIIAVLLIGGIILAIYFYPEKQVIITEQTTNQAVITSEVLEKLDFCSTEQECENYLISQGMPSDYLEKNDINIICKNGECYVEK